jgi:predicted nucleic acid-binding protein
MAMELNTKGRCAMNGPTRIVYDTCAATFLLRKDKRMLAIEPNLVETEKYASVITRMELYAEPNITRAKREDIDRFLADVIVIPLSDAVEDVAVEIRREFRPKLKLPDCIVAATAIALGATLLTDDAQLKNFVWPGYSVQAI